MLVDSHCHLDRLNLEESGENLEGVLASARALGVEHMLCVCISEENRKQVLAIADQFPFVSASVGVHPCDVKSAVIPLETLLEWSDSPKVVALGESGLDYHYSADTKTLQQQSFIHHLEAGKQLKLPVIVHTRSAQEDTLSLIGEHGCSEASGVLHCFTESWDMAKSALDMNYYISISGIVTFRNASELREVAKKVPSDRLLVETDSPYLAPVPHRGKSNQPKYVRDVAEFVAELRGVTLEVLAEQTTSNFSRLFPRAQLG